jgi:transcription elongation factor SPT5
VEGDHAKVINGVHKDDSGLVLKVENNVVTLLSDTTLKPLEVFSKDLRTTSEVSSITTNTSLYEVYDLIQLSYIILIQSK